MLTLKIKSDEPPSIPSVSDINFWSSESKEHFLEERKFTKNSPLSKICLQRPGKKNKGIGNQRKNSDHSDYSNIKIR